MIRILRTGRWLAVPLALAAPLALTACAGRPDGQTAFCTARSPAGLPLVAPLPDPDTCRQAVAGWFGRADLDGDGRVSLAEAEADAAALFDRLDTDGSGALVSTEADAARPPLRPGGPGGDIDLRRPPDAAQGGPADGGGAGRPGGRGPGGRGGAAVRESPVMAADSNADFRVTRDELAAQARRTLHWIDSDHDGALTPQEVMAGLVTVQQLPQPGSGGDRRPPGGRGGPGGGGPGGGAMAVSGMAVSGDVTESYL
ncbi:hypothetical protein [Rhodospirillum centenum]|uniref:EF-hand domain-containing protein n=1 Tax=Rhodospirillum centenum (strain ATCC 51521 / SW) TaxID=414684 RepID=B6IUJ5_RHOCS|nr:hypothetical protein [Rhodospirillum centenum]ACI99820.1 hypothetical protein RC1_2437 [Rhodospirillum centenum SW]